MRDYKFRGKCLNDCKWYEGYLVIFPNGLNCICYTNEDEFEQVTNIIPETVGQYTGLKDSKRTEQYPDGQEICYGDIVRFGGVDRIVTFEKGSFVLRTIKLLFAEPTPLMYCNLENLEVIGNFWDNSELLEGNTNDR